MTAFPCEGSAGGCLFPATGPCSWCGKGLCDSCYSSHEAACIAESEEDEMDDDPWPAGAEDLP